MIRGPEIIEAIVNEVRRRLQADCYLAPHMVHRSFSVDGHLGLKITTSGERGMVETGCRLLLDCGALGQVVQVSPAVIPERGKAAEPLPATRAEVPEAAPRQPVPVPPPADVESVCRLERIIREQPGQSSNEIFRRAGMGRARTLRLLNAHAGTLWKAVLNGQTRQYFPLSSGSFL
jgi:hypothetical protein